jgi:hypothetical protein
VFVQPSSLIFLVVIAIWATYLLQHWVRRREHLATARSVDRFSEAMRVLERRRPLPEADLSAPRARSYAISPARPSRPEVVVKRTAQSTTPTVAARPEAAVRLTRVFRALAGVSLRRARGLSLLVSLSLAVVISPLAGLSVLPWWSALVAVAVLAADFAWLRHAAVAERASRRATASARRAGAGMPGSETPAATDLRLPAPRQARFVVGSDPVVVSPVVDAVEVSEPSQSPAEADPSSWSPVPVPPPTYTLKAKAERPAPVHAEASVAPSAQDTSFDGVLDEDELDGLLDRRASGG